MKRIRRPAGVPTREAANKKEAPPPGVELDYFCADAVDGTGWIGCPGSAGCVNCASAVTIAAIAATAFATSVTCRIVIR
jgi:hypothetical protein